VRFYKGPFNKGEHIGRLYKFKGAELLKEVRFENESETGWQEAFFDPPERIDANEVYVVSYYAPEKYYARDMPYFTTEIGRGRCMRSLIAEMEGGLVRMAFSNTDKGADSLMVLSPPSRRLTIGSTLFSKSNARKISDEE
jgi:hypothetical protein